MILPKSQQQSLVELKKLFEQKKCIWQYVRDKHRNPIGCFIAVKTREGICVGWSKCNKIDRFNKDVGLAIAFARAIKKYGTKMPDTFYQDYEEFLGRSVRFFKGDF